MQKYGVEETTIVSSGSTYKNAGSPFRPQTEQDRKYLQALADSALDQFKKVVNDGRGSKLVAKPAELFSGRVFAGQDAMDAGLVDQIGYPADAYQFAAKQANLSKPTVVRYEEPAPSLLGLLTRGQTPVPVASNPTGQAGALTINGVDVRAGPEALDGFRTHRLLYR
jgi:protease-4